MLKFSSYIHKRGYLLPTLTKALLLKKMVNFNPPGNTAEAIAPLSTTQPGIKHSSCTQIVFMLQMTSDSQWKSKPELCQSKGRPMHAFSGSFLEWL